VLFTVVLVRKHEQCDHLKIQIVLSTNKNLHGAMELEIFEPFTCKNCIILCFHGHHIQRASTALHRAVFSDRYC